MLLCKTQEEIKTIEEGNEEKIRKVDNEKKQIDKEERNLEEIQCDISKWHAILCLLITKTNKKNK